MQTPSARFISILQILLENRVEFILVGMLISLNPLAPLATVPILRSDVEAQRVSAVSPMPLGLLNSFHTEEILDLLAYLESNGASVR